MPRWLSLIPLYWIASCRRPTGFPSAYQPATPPKPLTSLSYPPLVLQYQNPCKWIPPRFLVRNSRADWRLDSACTVLLPITTWGPTLSDPHVQRWVLFSQNLSYARFPCSQYNYSLQSVPLQPQPLSSWTTWLAGENSATNTASQNFHVLFTSHRLSRSPPRRLRAPSPV